MYQRVADKDISLRAHLNNSPMNLNTLRKRHKLRAGTQQKQGKDIQLEQTEYTE
ncbi:hypothetical protein Fmac_003468 [Flemingia macrophylla]|uniref:Uncharacterized protein n=1 Tax=Flemingia macrophylla TaxID=520843 RepID=A0ABD1NMU8_9FABA